MPETVYLRNKAPFVRLSGPRTAGRVLQWNVPLPFVGDAAVLQFFPSCFPLFFSFAFNQI
jgi:hypothetical protein